MQQQQDPPRLGLGLDDKLKVTEVVPGGPCHGQLHVGDIITHVNSKPVEGKDRQTLVELCCVSWRVILDILRPGQEGNDDLLSFKPLKRVIRLPKARPVHTRERIRKQLQDSQIISRDDSEIRRAFLTQAETSKEKEKFAHIPKDNLLPALSKLGIDVTNEAIDDFFKKTDTNGDGLIDWNEFLSVVLSPPGQPKGEEIRRVFNAMNPSPPDQDGRSFIRPDQLEAAVTHLEMSKKLKQEVLVYLSKGAIEDGKICFEEFNQAVRSTTPLRDEQEIMDVYEEFATAGNFQYIPEQKLRAALQDLGLLVTDEQLREFVRIVHLNFGGKIRFDAFKHIVLSPSPVEAWAQSLPLAKLLADALPRNASCDHLRVISSMTPQEIETVSSEVGAALQDLLTAHVRQLSRAFSAMDDEMLWKSVPASGKFEVVKMATGKIRDFYEGLEARIGSCPPNFKDAMEAEHCRYKGHDIEFSTSNHNEIQTCARKEWEIVVKKRPCPETEMRWNRRIPDLESLYALPLTKRANLSNAEVISIVLYTGPMYVIYNAIPRRYPEDIYKKFEAADNLFSTTIFVLASAVQKISRVMKLPKDMILYRGLGGTADLPDSFFQADECGCKGFVEWGFMSTSSSKAVAIDYSGLNQQKPLPYILAIHVGSADCGACVREYSQYAGEATYLYAPMSYIEQIKPECLEVASAGVVRLIPVKVNANMKTESTDQLEKKKKTLHLASFKYRIHEIQAELNQLADTKEAQERIAKDKSNEGMKLTLAAFVDKIVLQCKDVYSKHNAISYSDYKKDTWARSLVLEMVDIKEMAIAKLKEWIQNHQNSFIQFRFNSPLRTAHRRWTMFLHKKFIASSGEKKSEAATNVLKARGFIMDRVDETNELYESVLMTTAAEGRSKCILELLICAKADVNGARPDGVTPIWLAAQFDHEPTISALIEFNAEVDKAATNGATALYTAAQSGNVECIELLAKSNADVRKADKDGITPLHQAAMNGFENCIKTLIALNADVNQKDWKGSTASDYAKKNGHSDCVSILYGENLYARKDKTITYKPSDSNKFIISSGDISNIDGLLALAHYAKTGADVAFVMNYPAYVGLSESEDDAWFPEMNLGLGYKYSAAHIIDTDKATERYKRFVCSYKGSANDRMKGALTDLAFQMVNSVWADMKGDKGGGQLLFCIGGVNAVNPFSPKAITNEVLVYSEILKPPTRQLPPTQGIVYNKYGTECQIDWDAYSDIYIDFNGSMAFWDDSWETELTERANKIRGAFIMGGVRAHETPITMSSIPNVLNRLSGATMNQLYHPESASKFFGFLASRQIPAFVITNNAVKGLETVDQTDKKTPTYEGVEKFMDSNQLTSKSLREYAKAYYTSVYTPPRKPFDFYTALALNTWLTEGSTCTKPESESSRRWLFYDNVYGITYVSKSEKWEVTRESYIGSVDVTENEDDSDFARNKKEYFRKEILVMKEIPFVGQLPVFEVSFSMDGESKLLTMDDPLPPPSESTSFNKQLAGYAIVPNPWPSRASAGSTKLIISSGDMSNIDGLLALAHYAKTGADVAFVMNYPAYVGLSESEEDATYAEMNLGLGYKYSAAHIIDTDKATERYKRFVCSYKGSANDRMKGALTDLAFQMVNSVWADMKGDKGGGQLLFCIGGVNAVNPFSQTAISNEVLVYSEILKPPTRQLPPTQGIVYNKYGAECQIDWDAYSDIYIDFNGSMAFWDDSWETELTERANKIRGAFIMGGVRAHETPITMSSIPNVLNRLSGATMNQLYHPESASKFFGFLASRQIPAFVITNNAVKGLETVDQTDKKTPTYEGVEKFMDSNQLTSKSLREYAKAYYTSVYKPPRKPFDFYTALALNTWLTEGSTCTKLTSESSRRWLFYSNVYGITYVSKSEKWEVTRESYIGSVDVTENEDDSDFARNKKEYFQKEILVMKEIPFVGQLPVFEVNFVMDGESKLLTIT